MPQPDSLDIQAKSESSEEGTERRTKRPHSCEGEEEEFRVGSFPHITADNTTDIKESTIPQNPTLDTPETDQRLLLTTHSEKHEHSHHPLETLRSMRTTEYTHRNSVYNL
jgi:hypothetical protein